MDVSLSRFIKELLGNLIQLKSKLMILILKKILKNVVDVELSLSYLVTFYLWLNYLKN